MPLRCVLCAVEKQITAQCKLQLKRVHVICYRNCVVIAIMDVERILDDCVAWSGMQKPINLVGVELVVYYYYLYHQVLVYGIKLIIMLCTAACIIHWLVGLHGWNCFCSLLHVLHTNGNQWEEVLFSFPCLAKIARSSGGLHAEVCVCMDCLNSDWLTVLLYGLCQERTRFAKGLQACKIQSKHLSHIVLKGHHGCSDIVLLIVMALVEMCKVFAIASSWSSQLMFAECCLCATLCVPPHSKPGLDSLCDIAWTLCPKEYQRTGSTAWALQSAP